MPTIFSHGIVGIALGKVFTSETLPARFWVLTLVCPILPDLDVIGFEFGIGYRDMLGHRGLSHSLPFALLIAFGAAWIALSGTSPARKAWLPLVLFFFAVTASHGLLDALTDGGLGVAFFAPFSNTRYFLPWRPIKVSPLGPDAFFGRRGLAALWSEFKWIWIPSATVFVIAHQARARLRKGRASS